LLSENQYCLLTRAIGMIQSLILCGFNDVELVLATDSGCESHYLVLVDNKILNYWPNTVKSNILADFTVQRTISITPLIKKIR
jgi:hypothetical protein